MSYAFLVADRREREVLPHLRPLLQQGAFKSEACRRAAAGAPGLIEETIHTGDYLLCRKNAGQPGVQVIACFERKSIKDFVSSVGDGRMENRGKMLELRESTGCQLYYIIEGRAFASPEWQVGRGMKYKTIITAMTTMPLHSGIHVLQTKDTQNTAERLRDFVLEMNQACEPYLYPLGDGGAAPCSAVQTKAGTMVPDMVTGVYEKDPDSLCIEVWSKLAGVSVTTAKILVGLCSVREYVCGEGPSPQDIKTPSNRSLVKKARASLQALLDGDEGTGLKVLSGVPGLSHATAVQIFEAVPDAYAGQGGKMRTLVGMRAADLAEVRVKQKSRTIRLGQKSVSILRMLNWKTGCEGADAAHVAPVAQAAHAAPVAQAAPVAKAAPQYTDTELSSALDEFL